MNTKLDTYSKVLLETNSALAVHYLMRSPDTNLPVGADHHLGIALMTGSLQRPHCTIINQSTDNIGISRERRLTIQAVNGLRPPKALFQWKDYYYMDRP
jgi:hypothetical protein